jgi:Flp pilus assembly protein TadG
MSSRSKKMESFKKVRQLGNDRGVAVILVAGIMVAFLLLFMVVGLEFARMYYVRGQLQNAADSAALAGAQKITDPTNTSQTDARNAAAEFAAQNKAAGLDVFLANNGTNTTWPDSTANDIAVGFWSDTPQTCPSTGLTDNFCPGGITVPGVGGTSQTLVNAIKVVPQRASGLEPARGSVDFLFTGIGNLVGWTKMDVRRQAIASKRPAVDTFITVCWNTDSGNKGLCQLSDGTSCLYPNACSSTAVQFLLNTTTSGCDPLTNCSDSMAWSSLLNNTSTNDVGSLLCGPQPVERLCPNGQITTSGGTESGSFARIEALMYNPAYDGGNKTCGPVGGPFIENSCTSSSAPVNGWWVEVPILNVCPPTNQPNPIPVWGYAKLHIVAACGSSASVSPCAQYSAPKNPVDACKDYYGSLYTAKYGSNGTNYLAIDGIQCVDCANSPYTPGVKAALVK